MTEPLCPYFGRCGGCTQQDRDHADQVAAKAEALAAVVGVEDFPVFTGSPYHYRNRMDFAFHPQGLGLRERGAFDRFVDIERCAIADPELNALLSEVREHFRGVFYFDVRRRFGAFCYAVLRTPPGDSSVSIVLNQKDKKLAEAVARIRAYADISRANNVIVTFVPHNRNVSVSESFELVKGSDELSETYRDRTFRFPVQGFFQVNHDMAARVHGYVGDRLSSYDTAGAVLVDLYAGVGTFAIMNAHRFRRVAILENYAPAIRAARRNLEENRVTNAELICRDARHLDKLDFPDPKFIILDPPRSGIHPKTLAALNRISAETVFYVSCNPKLLAQDLGRLDRFRVKSAALFDMFPQTPHMEAVVELVPQPGA
jgi:23S rRNA (uracil-5-)-methyltransferase RumA